MTQLASYIEVRTMTNRSLIGINTNFILQ